MKQSKRKRIKRIKDEIDSAMRSAHYTTEQKMRILEKASKEIARVKQRRRKK